MAEFAAQVELYYLNMDQQVIRTAFDIPSNATVNANLSMCDPDGPQEVFALDFHTESLQEGYLAAIFNRNNKTNDSTLDEVMITIRITEDIFPGIDHSVVGKCQLFHLTSQMYLNFCLHF